MMFFCFKEFCARWKGGRPRDLRPEAVDEAKAVETGRSWENSERDLEGIGNYIENSETDNGLEP